MHYNIYRKQKKQESRDGGVTFTDVIPYEYQKGAFIMSATTCSERNVNQVERWVDDTLYISPDAGISWENTGIEREDSMEDAPEDVLRINNRQYYPVEVEYNEYFKVLLPEDLSGSTYIALFIYGTPKRDERPIGQLAASPDYYQCINLTTSDFQWVTDGDITPDEQFIERALNFRCRHEGGMKAYLTLKVYVSPTSQTLIYETNNVEILHDTRSVPERTLSSPSQTRNLRTIPDYNSYYLYQKQVKSDVDINWQWKYPFEFSASTEVAVVNDKSCGYVEEDPVIYRWIDTEGIVCDEVEDEEMYAWRETGGFLCIGGNKYAVEVYSVSYNGGLTWSIVSPPEYRKGRLISTNADDCNGGVDVLYVASYASLPDQIPVINPTANITSAVLDGDIAVDIVDGKMSKEWLEDGATGFTLNFVFTNGYLQDRLWKDIPNITSVTTRARVSFFGDEVFGGTNLATLDVYANAPYCSPSALPSTINEIIVNSGRKQWFDSAYGWSAYAGKIVERI